MYPRIMIIIWKWRQLVEENKVYDLFPIQSKAEDVIIRINEEKYEHQTLQDILNYIQANYDQVNVFCFLHRSTFNHNELEFILKAFKTEYIQQLKGFLFSSGSDQIYFDTNEFGLLSAANYDFFYEANYEKEILDKNGQAEIVEKSVLIRNEVLQRNEVELLYFDRTWKYYEHEFKKKIDSLHIDLLSHFAEIPCNGWNNGEHPGTVWKDKIGKDRLLFLRLNSFLNTYKDCELDDYRSLLSHELRQLKEYEEEEEISFAFDDCFANLKEEAKTAYQDIYDTLTPIFKEGSTTEKMSMEKLNRKFSNLLKQLH